MLGDLQAVLALGNHDLHGDRRRRRLAQRGDRRGIALVVAQQEATGVQLAPLTLDERAQVEEEPGGDDPVAGEDRADLARARVLRNHHDHPSVSRAGERLEQRRQEPHDGDRRDQCEQGAHTRACQSPRPPPLLSDPCLPGGRRHYRSGIDRRAGGGGVARAARRDERAAEAGSGTGGGAGGSSTGTGIGGNSAGSSTGVGIDGTSASAAGSSTGAGACGASAGSSTAGGGGSMFGASSGVSPAGSTDSTAAAGAPCEPRQSVPRGGGRALRGRARVPRPCVRGRVVIGCRGPRQGP